MDHSVTNFDTINSYCGETARNETAQQWKNYCIQSIPLGYS